MSLSRLLRILAWASAALMLLIAGRVAFTDWQAYRRISSSVQAVSDFRLALGATEMVSRERGPTNGVLGDEAPPAGDRVEALSQARSRTNEALGALEQVLVSAATSPHQRHALARLREAQEALRDARVQVDQTLRLPKAERTPDAIHVCVERMVAVVPLLAPIVSKLGNDVQEAMPALGDFVQGARLASELREYAGLLGSHFTVALARQQALTPADRAAIERTRGRIDELRFLLGLRLQGLVQPDGVLEASQAVQSRYFSVGNKLIDQLIEASEHNGRYGLDPAAFAQVYVPEMNAILALRDVLIAHAMRRSVQERKEVAHTLIWVGVGTGMMLVLLVFTINLLNRRVLQPLQQTSLALHAMASEDLDAPLPVPVANDEMAAVVRAVHTLRVQTRQRLLLEAERQELIQRLRDQSNTDFLTGLPNRRAFFEAAERDLAQAIRHGFGVVAILLDVDRFKQFNDTHGHAAGDEALLQVGVALRRVLRQGDLVARFGGEEFVLLLGHCDLADGLRFAERVREVIAHVSIAVPSGQMVHVTASLGVADSAAWGLDIDVLLSHADAAMYRAKEGGRNQVAVAT